MNDRRVTKARECLAEAADLLRECLAERQNELDEMPERGFYERWKELTYELEVLEQIDVDDIDIMVSILS